MDSGGANRPAALISPSCVFQAQGGESQQEAQRLQAQLNELQAQLSQKEQAAEHYKLQVRSLVLPTCPTPPPPPTHLPSRPTPPHPHQPTCPSAHPDGEGQDSL